MPYFLARIKLDALRTPLHTLLALTAPFLVSCSGRKVQVSEYTVWGWSCYSEAPVLGHKHTKRRFFSVCFFLEVSVFCAHCKWKSVFGVRGLSPHLSSASTAWSLTDPVVPQVAGQSLSLVLGVILPLPGLERLTGHALVLILPLENRSSRSPLHMAVTSCHTTTEQQCSNVASLC